MNSPPDYADWMRTRFPVLNKKIDDGDAESLQALVSEIPAVTKALRTDLTHDERERFTYVSMIYSALWHHKVLGTIIKDVESLMAELAKSIGVVPRFLASFYLRHNPEIPDMNGRFAQFREADYETAFLRINREGTLLYEQGAKALWSAYRLLMTSPTSVDSLNSLLDEAANCFRRISQGNAMLLRTPGGEEFAMLTQYFSEVRVEGVKFRGVNAGDQPWSFVIDLVLGVDLKHVFQTAFEDTPVERHYPAEIRTSVDVVRYEFDSKLYLRRDYLRPEDDEKFESVLDTIDAEHDLIALLERAPEQERPDLAKRLHAVIKNYLAASDVHFKLAKRHVPINAQGEQIGSAGTNIRKFLWHGLNDERRKVQQKLEQLYPRLFPAAEQSATA
jgi:hypothetical protein